MKVRILQGFSNYTPGQVFEDWPDGMCEIFVARGLIERVADEAADVEPEVEKAEVPNRRKRK